MSRLLGFGTFSFRVTALAGTQLFVSGRGRYSFVGRIPGGAVPAPEPTEVHLPDRDVRVHAAGLFDADKSTGPVAGARSGRAANRDRAGEGAYGG